MPKRLIIAALASRTYVAAAVAAGCEVIALDAFADADTRQNAWQFQQIPVTEKGFDAEKLLACLDKLALESVDGFCFGAGFERQPELLDLVSAKVKLLGNPAETVRLSKSPVHFANLCEQLGMLHPAMSLEPPSNRNGWLYKEAGGSGGAHIRRADALKNDHGYYQEFCAGVPISCLFAVVDEVVQLIGFNEQWCSPTDAQPCRFGGAASQAKLPQKVKAEISTFVTCLASALGLRGINSVDFIVDGEAVYALELNPRLSATLALYGTEAGALWNWHVGDAQTLKLDTTARALNVIYADAPVQIGEQWRWPEWVSDIPMSGSLIEAGMPICSVNAQAEGANQAKQRVLERSGEIRNWLYSKNNKSRNGELECNNK